MVSHQGCLAQSVVCTLHHENRKAMRDQYGECHEIQAGQRHRETDCGMAKADRLEPEHASATILVQCSKPWSC